MQQESFDVLILGLAPQGLFLLREFSKVGKRVLAVGLKGQVGLFSKYGHKIAIKNLSELEWVFDKYLINKDSKIHITSDPFLNYLLSNKHKIFEENQCFPNYHSASIFCDKVLTEKLAKRLGIPCLHSYKLDEIDENNFDIYPSIIKWNKRYGGEKFKTILIKSIEDLKKVKTQANSDKHLIIQKYILGGSDSDISYGGYWLEGRERLHIIIEQKRQYPYPNGLAGFAEECHGKFANQIRDISIDILQETNYSGFVEVECRVDKKENKLYLIEVNPRACGWIKIIKKKFPNLNLASTCEQGGLTNNGASWVNLVRDLRAIIDILIKNPKKLSFKNLLSDYLNNPIKDVFEFRDLMPFIFQFKKIFQKKSLFG